MLHNELPEYGIKQSKKFMEIADKTLSNRIQESPSQNSE